MASITDYLDKMVIGVSSPDGNIRATVSNYTDVAVEFAPGTFDRYEDERLGHQLARLGVTTWVAYHRGRSEAYRRSMNLTHEELAEAERPSTDPRRRAYEEQLNLIQGEGVSARGALRVHTVGMMKWTVDVEPGAVRRFGEKHFLTEIHTALHTLLADRERKIIVLKSEHFDVGIPKKWLDLMRDIQATNRRRSGSPS
jgi:hypothetical protein